MRTTVITPAYNAAPFIADAIRSVLAQTRSNLRLVIVDDGSTDATAAIASSFTDPRLCLIRQSNAGVAAARNRGMAAAGDADALLFLDADDWLAPTALATLSAGLQAVPQAIAAVGQFAVFDACGRLDRSAPGPAAGHLHPRRHGSPRAAATPLDLLERLVVQNQFANGGHLLIRRAAARAAGSFRPGISYGEDWDFFIRLALRGPFALLTTPDPLLFVRTRPDGAYRRFATESAAFAPCMAAIFDNPDLHARLGAARVATLRRRAEAENAWIIGRELLRQGRGGEGRPWLRRSVAAAPSLHRVALLGAAHALSVLPRAWHGPFRAYPAIPGDATP